MPQEKNRKLEYRVMVGSDLFVVTLEYRWRWKEDGYRWDYRVARIDGMGIGYYASPEGEHYERERDAHGAAMMQVLMIASARRAKEVHDIETKAMERMEEETTPKE